MHPSIVSHRALRAHLLLAMGLVACSTTESKETDDTGGIHNPNGDDGDDGGDGGDGTDGGDGGDGADGGDDGTLPSHWEECDPDVPDLDREMIMTSWVEEARLCAEPDAAGECLPKEDFPATEVMSSLFDLGGTGRWFEAWPSCGPDTNTPDQCCYIVSVSELVEGRPFLVDGRARVGRGGQVEGWQSETALCADHLDPADRGRLGRAWARRGRYEHASVASFARFALQLVHLGAPADLLAATSRAMADEVRHARLAFGIAVALGEDAGPGPLPVEGALEGLLSPEAVLRTLIEEGCIGETLAAAEAAEAARQAGNAQVREALEVIAADEARHAALAWRTARWLLSAWPELRPLAEELLEARAGSFEDAAPGVNDDLAGRWGLLSGRLRQALAAEVLAQVVRPCAREMLHQAQGSTSIPCS